jgi:hypothetical protein
MLRLGNGAARAAGAPRGEQRARAACAALGGFVKNVLHAPGSPVLGAAARDGVWPLATGHA